MNRVYAVGVLSVLMILGLAETSYSQAQRSGSGDLFYKSMIELGFTEDIKELKTYEKGFLSRNFIKKEDGYPCMVVIYTQAGNLQQVALVCKGGFPEKTRALVMLGAYGLMAMSKGVRVDKASEEALKLWPVIKDNLQKGGERTFTWLPGIIVNTNDMRATQELGIRMRF